MKRNSKRNNSQRKHYRVPQIEIKIVILMEAMMVITVMIVGIEAIMMMRIMMEVIMKIKMMMMGSTVKK
jgi:hypothetical protein